MEAEGFCHSEFLGQWGGVFFVCFVLLSSVWFFDTFYPFGIQASLFHMLVIPLPPAGILQHKVLTELSAGTRSL